MPDNDTSNLESLEQKEDKDVPFVHRFWLIGYKEKKFPYKDLLELHVLKLCNMAKCHLKKIDENENSKKSGYNYYVVAEGKKQKLMLLMELCKAWNLGDHFAGEIMYRRLNLK